jgi:hypothetical protein
MVIGCDVAWMGEDSSTIAINENNKIHPIIIINKFDPYEVAREVKIYADEYKPTNIYIDVIGIGAGVVADLLHSGYPVTGINIAKSAWNKDRFKILRDELWWNLRECVNPRADNPVLLPDDKILLKEISKVSYGYRSGKIEIESKDEMKKKIGHSPDRSDAVCLALIGYEHTNQKTGGSSGLGIGWDNY